MTQLLLTPGLLSLWEESGGIRSLNHMKLNIQQFELLVITDWVANRFQDLMNCLIKSSQPY